MELLAIPRNIVPELLTTALLNLTSTKVSLVDPPQIVAIFLRLAPDPLSSALLTSATTGPIPTSAPPLNFCVVSSNHN